MLNLACANPKCEGAESSMRGGVTVTTDNGGTRKGEALLWTDDVDDALSLVPKAEVGQTEVLHVLFEGNTLSSRVVLFDEVGHVLEILPGGGGDILLLVSIMFCEGVETHT